MTNEKIFNIKEVIAKLPSEFRGIENKENIDLKKIWNLVSESASSHSYPLRLKGKTLFVCVDSSCWLYVLNLSKNKLLYELNKFLNTHIDDVRFVIKTDG